MPPKKLGPVGNLLKGVITNHLLCVVVARRKRRFMITYQGKIIRMLKNSILKTQKKLAWGKGNGQRLCPCGEKIAGAYGAVILGSGS